jgi:pyruvate ferredoxin oxidoreductase delta subunit
MNRPTIYQNYPMPTRAEELPFGPSSAAGVIIEGNAGWRVKRPIVDDEKCIRCQICWTFCPEGVIDREIHIDMNFCKGCGICAHECPKKAITMVSEGGERNE